MNEKGFPMVRMKRVFLVASLTLILPTALAAQQRSPAPAAARQQAAAPNQQQVQQWVTELRQLHQRLEQIQTKAAEDPQIQAAQNALGLELKAAMEKADPQLPARLQRLQALEAEAVKAQQSGDQAKLQQLIQEAQTIQNRFVEAQARVFQQPAMAAKVQAFQTRLEARMAQVDAQSPTLIRRFQELEGKLNAAMQVSQQR
jgi:predicted nuclease with TOPRIM domain